MTHDYNKSLEECVYPEHNAHQALVPRPLMLHVRVVNSKADTACQSGQHVRAGRPPLNLSAHPETCR